MGNHEYCITCGEDDFHTGIPCDPKKVAKVQAERKRHESRYQAALFLVRAMLDSVGIIYTVKDSHIIIWPIDNIIKEELDRATTSQ